MKRSLLSVLAVTIFLVMAVAHFGTDVLLDISAGKFPAFSSSDPLQFFSSLITYVQNANIEHFRNDGLVFIFLIFIFYVALSYFAAYLLTRWLATTREKQKFFAANVSHELRTPLSVLKTTAEVERLRTEGPTADEFRRFTTNVIEEANRMSNIIDFFLHFSMLQNGDHLHMGPVNLSSVIKKTGTLLGVSAAEKGIHLQISTVPQLIVEGNYTALEELIVNLTKNAIRHTPRGGTIEISSERRKSEVVLSVRDTGEGIPEEDLSHIFDIFYKGSNSGKHGSGLGLAIVRQIAEIHNATIDVKSTAGVGTVFVVHFPPN